METKNIPLDVALWDTKTIAEYFKAKPNTVYKSITSNPSFPKRIRIKSTGDGYLKPLWRAVEVVEWANSYQEK